MRRRATSGHGQLDLRGDGIDLLAVVQTGMEGGTLRLRSADGSAVRISQLSGAR